MTITITSSGINFPSNGTLGGFYAGTNSATTSYPIGSFVLAEGDLVQTANTTTALYIDTVYNTQWTVYGGTGYSVCAGTWQFRGQAGGTGYSQQYLVQRIS